MDQNDKQHKIRWRASFDSPDVMGDLLEPDEDLRLSFTSTRRQKQFLCQILVSDANVVSVLEGLGALPLNWSYKAMPRSSRSELVCDGLRLF